MIIGLISDTHGWLRPEAIGALTGSELIIHAGDVGKPDIIAALERLAPVTAVRGNVDTAPPLQTLPASATLNIETHKIYIIHNLADLHIDPAASGIDIVISGHSHKPGTSERGGVLYINPGSAGPRRFRLPVTLARLDTKPKPPKLEFVTLL
jgi:uncharacterized protein